MSPADRHLDDAELVARYFEPPPADESTALHLFRCDHCSRRRQELTALLDRVHDQGVAEADHVFDAARLAAQRQAIQARLAGPRRARVLSFPQPVVEPQAPPVVEFRMPWRRAAAAVLVVAMAGAGVARFVQVHEATQTARRPVADGQLARASARPVSPQAEERLLGEIELALASPGVSELRALDDLTPHVREVAAAAIR